MVSPQRDHLGYNLFHLRADPNSCSSHLGCYGRGDPQLLAPSVALVESYGKYHVSERLEL